MQFRKQGFRQILEQWTMNIKYDSHILQTTVVDV